MGFVWPFTLNTLSKVDAYQVPLSHALGKEPKPFRWQRLKFRWPFTLDAFFLVEAYRLPISPGSKIGSLKPATSREERPGLDSSGGYGDNGSGQEQPSHGLISSMSGALSPRGTDPLPDPSGGSRHSGSGQEPRSHDSTSSISETPTPTRIDHPPGPTELPTPDPTRQPETSPIQQDTGIEQPSDLGSIPQRSSEKKREPGRRAANGHRGRIIPTVIRKWLRRAITLQPGLPLLEQPTIHNVSGIVSDLTWLLAMLLVSGVLASTLGVLSVQALEGMPANAEIMKISSEAGAISAVLTFSWPLANSIMSTLPGIKAHTTRSWLSLLGYAILVSYARALAVTYYAAVRVSNPDPRTLVVAAAVTALPLSIECIVSIYIMIVRPSPGIALILPVSLVSAFDILAVSVFALVARGLGNEVFSPGPGAGAGAVYGLFNSLWIILLSFFRPLV
ncbi:hypothetical protein NUW58_g1793 [Xylaria curta]|uniref:Uncharacterized protein n=1 Tax=Xylaria curta TaxID=42375 RepID=A0ACC1PKC7_9PEZI|nr:hypothetical protein NUW58_g1793 [Xylaria curta]